MGSLGETTMDSKMQDSKLSTGIAGLDEVLVGGFLPGRSYLVRGGPGTGKSTVGLHFLIAGADSGEKVLYITLDESKTQIIKDGEKKQFNMKGLSFLDLSPTSEFFSKMETYDIFSPAEVEREPLTRQIIENVEKLKPRRVFLDAITQFRYLIPDAFQFRKQVVSFLRFLQENGATVLLASEGSKEAPDEDLQFLTDGILELKYNGGARTLSMTKFRGSDFQKGDHSLKLDSTGATLFPKLVPGAFRQDFLPDTLSSGIPELDELLNGGLERGTVTIITGPTGVGKTTLGSLFMKEAAGRGERSVLYTFEENIQTLLQRSESINIPIHTMIQNGSLSVISVEPLQYTPEEFSRLVRREVEVKGATIVMIDSMSGYRLSLGGADIISNVHALSKYLANMGVTVLLINEVEAITGEFKATEMSISYLADNIVFLRYIEIDGEMRKVLGVLKKRLSSFQRTLRELEVTKFGVKVGKPLSNLRGILSGKPELIKKTE
jgi:circadian clock protein KaiC